MSSSIAGEIFRFLRRTFLVGGCVGDGAGWISKFAALVVRTSVMKKTSAALASMIRPRSSGDANSSRRERAAKRERRMHGSTIHAV